MNTTLTLLREIFPERFHPRLHLVGGSVRDFLCSRGREDVDLFAEMAPEDLIRLGFRAVTPRSAAPIYFRHYPSLGKVEVTVPEKGVTLVDDLRRRDFTVNAMALTLDGELVDPLGGREALATKLLFPCSETIFVDDPVRIFRAFRFETGGWRLAPEGELLLGGTDWNPHLSRLPVERFSQEMLKALAGADPRRFFARMAEAGVGKTLIPELFRMSEVVAGPPAYHPEGDLLTHSLQTLARMAALTAEVTSRFCAMFHDLGKLATPEQDYPRHHGHDRAGVPLAEQLCIRLRLPAAMRKALMGSCRLHLVGARWGELRDGTKLKVAGEARRGGIAAVLPLLVAADKGGIQVMEDYELALRVLELGIRELGIDPRLMGEWPPTISASPSGGNEVHPLPPEERQAVIRSRRVAEFRRRAGR